MTVLAAHHPVFTSTVPRQYVHKAAQSEVLLTGCEVHGDDNFTVAAQWPRTHSFYDSADGRHDPLLLVETVRQAIPLLSHLGYDAPFGHRQIWDHLTWTASPAALVCEPTPAEIVARITCSEVVRRGSRLAALTMDVDMTRDGVHLGTANTHFTNQSPAIYQRLRGEYADIEHAVRGALTPASPIAPPVAGRDRRRDVVLAPTDTPNRYQLRVDLAHPALFDHRTDHAPGMLLLEAARQAAYAVAYPEIPVITGMHSTFQRYVELDAPCWVEVEILPAQLPTHVSSRVSITQHGQEAFTATVTALRGRASGGA
ncbi:ScbA/BarX family gamma-butyrolactone biosynthesis protein [Streptacidiphilus sp. MAP5-3]|uniref:ScbA/BarX family gamma-butyrolactone biosynthesis protein n=1 Tax=unclassified Streptacidiphilus TaxID=2643834 RepID=UPI00351760F9